MIIIVEDDENIREMESYALRNSGYDVCGVSGGKELNEKLSQMTPELILLDIMLPGEDGLSILKRLRSTEKTRRVPIILVTAKTTELDKVRGLDMGADDYISKPFGIMELVSRVKALLRRTGHEDQVLLFGGVRLDERSRRVSVSGRDVELTFKEFELLRYLLVNAGQVMGRDKILSDVWGFDYEGESRTVDMHIKTLRQKLGDAGTLIKTVRSVGYMIGE